MVFTLICVISIITTFANEILTTIIIYVRNIICGRTRLEHLLLKVKAFKQLRAVEYKGKLIVLENAQGQRFQVSYDILSSADQDYMRKSCYGEKNY